MNQNFKVYIFVILFVLAGVNLASAKSVYEGCIYGFQFEEFDNFKPVEVPATTGTCGLICTRECRSMFLGQVEVDSTLSDSDLIDAQIGINPEVYYSCLKNCKSGNATAEYFPRVQVNNSLVNPEFEYRGPVKIGFTCPASHQFPADELNGDARKKFINDPRNNINSGFAVSAGSEVSVNFVSSPNNSVSMCGSQAFQVIPLIKDIQHSEWERDDVQNQIQKKSEHLCSEAMMSFDSAESTYTPISFDDLTNKKLWSIPDGLETRCSWNARHNKFLNTGVYAKDGDEVLISWNGNFATKKHSNNRPIDRNFLFSALSGDAITNDERTEYEELYRIISTLELRRPGDPLDAVSAIKFVGEDSRDGGFDSIGSFPPCFIDGDTYNVLGLKGCVTDSNIDYMPKVGDPRCLTSDQLLMDAEYCKIPISPGDSKYTFSGTLSGFSASEEEISIRHPDDEVGQALDNTGGFEVTVRKRGCVYTDGERLEYTIFNDSSDVKNRGAENEYVDVQWKSVSSEMLFGTTPIKADKSGVLHFRVKPLEAPALDVSDYKNREIMLNYGQGGMDGSYKFSLFQLQDSGFLYAQGPLRKIVQDVIKTLFGGQTVKMVADYSIEMQRFRGKVTAVKIPALREEVVEIKGAVQTIYEEVIKDNDFIQVIRALLVFYFAFLGFGFILGVIQTSQQELVIRCVKVAFVLTLISETSWEFFSSGFFNIFIYGGIELISYIATGGLGEMLPLKPEQIQEDPSIIFAIFDGLIIQLFSPNVWIKVGTYAISGAAGLFVAVIVTISILNYVFVILKAFLLYLMALVMTATLLVVAPVFIPFVLFQFTKQFFDLWWKMLISFTIQPVAIFSSIAIFNVLIAIAIYTVLSHTVCPICYFKIAIPLSDDICILPWYQLLYNSHLPEGVSSIDLPGNLITSAITLMILTGACYTFVEYIARVIAMIINLEVGLRGGSLGGGEQGGSYTQAASNMAKGGVRSVSSAVAGQGGRLSGAAFGGARDGFNSARGGDSKVSGKKGDNKQGGKQSSPGTGVQKSQDEKQ